MAWVVTCCHQTKWHSTFSITLATGAKTFSDSQINNDKILDGPSVDDQGLGGDSPVYQLLMLVKDSFPKPPSGRASVLCKTSPS